MTDKAKLVTAFPVKEGPQEAVNVEAEHLDFTRTTPIPDSFTICGPCCCAIRCNYCDFPSCFGCKGNCQICCFEQEGFCCKFISHDKVCCICFHDALECVVCSAACKAYRQCCCCEWICGCPLESAYVSTEAAFSSIPTNDGSVNSKDVIPCNACLCSISSCYFSFPSILSCYEKTTCCCLESEAACCKIMLCTENRKKNSLCIVLAKQNFFCLWPTTCIKTMNQCLCIDSRCALPCDSEVPFLCMCLPFCTCCVNGDIRCECCQPLSTLLGGAAKSRSSSSTQH
jgi:hypothetical protein